MPSALKLKPMGPEMLPPRDCRHSACQILWTLHTAGQLHWVWLESTRMPVFHQNWFTASKNVFSLHSEPNETAKYFLFHKENALGWKKSRLGVSSRTFSSLELFFLDNWHFGVPILFTLPREPKCRDLIESCLACKPSGWRSLPAQKVGSIPKTVEKSLLWGPKVKYSQHILAHFCPKRWFCYFSTSVQKGQTVKISNLLSKTSHLVKTRPL